LSLMISKCFMLFYLMMTSLGRNVLQVVVKQLAIYVVIDGLYIMSSSHQPSVYPDLVTDIALPEFCNHQTVARVTATSSKMWDIEYTSMPSPVHQVMITLTLNLSSRRSTSISMYVSLLEKCVLGTYIFRFRRSH
jgi:hypothetical protein